MASFHFLVPNTHFSDFSADFGICGPRSQFYCLCLPVFSLSGPNDGARYTNNENNEPKDTKNQSQCVLGNKAMGYFPTL